MYSLILSFLKFCLLIHEEHEISQLRYLYTVSVRGHINSRIQNYRFAFMDLCNESYHWSPFSELNNCKSIMCLLFIGKCIPARTVLSALNMREKAVYNANAPYAVFHMDRLEQDQFYVLTDISLDLIPKREFLYFIAYRTKL